jgi:hypothetical protein
MKTELDNLSIEKLAQEVATLLRPYFNKQEDVNFSVETLAEYLNVTKSWVYAHMGILPRFKIDGLIRFRKKDIDALIGQNILKVYAK